MLLFFMQIEDAQSVCSHEAVVSRGDIFLKQDRMLF